MTGSVRSLTPWVRGRRHRTCQHGSVFISWGLLTAAVAVAEAQAERPDRGIILFSDLITRAAPEGVMLFAGGAHRWSLDGRSPEAALQHAQLGLTLGVNPAYGSLSAHAEAAPLPFLVLRGSYELQAFYGGFGTLLSFSDPEADFSPSALQARSGEEVSGFAHRFSGQSTLRAKAGFMLFRARTSLHHFRFSKGGPLIYEFEFDTLLERNDAVFEQDVAVLLEPWSGPDGGTFLIGPAYDISRTLESGITRQRASAQMVWLMPRRWLGPANARLYGQLGALIEARNRSAGDFFGVVGFGADFNLF